MARRRRRPGPWPRRLGALLLGTVATLVGLELLLAGGYRVWVWKQRHDNLAALDEHKGDVRILAVGESTTAVAGDPTGAMLVPYTSWPSQLEARLNARDDGRTYRVWNNGIMGGTSSESLELLESTLPVLDPHIIVVMMGIKDTPDELMPYFNTLPHTLRASHVVQLAAWLLDGRALHVNAHVTDIRTPADLPPLVRARRSHNGMYIKEVGIVQHPEAVDLAGVVVYLWCVGRLQQAEAIARDIVARFDVGHNLLAYLVHNSGRQAEAIAELRAVAHRRPSEPMHHVVLAELLLRDRDTEGAAEAIAAARAGVDQHLTPGSPEAQLTLQMALLVEAERLLTHERWADVRALVEQMGPVARLQRPYADVFPPPDLLAASALGRAAIGTRDWTAAEAHLLRAIEADPRKMVNLFLLSKVYRETGRTEDEEALRQRLLHTSGRMAEYFELAKLFRLTGHPERADEILEQAVEDIPSLRQNMRTLYEIAERDGITLVVMQYPGFPVDALAAYAPAREGVVFIDNEHLFDADPDAYFFEPTYPNSFSHYTEAGATRMASHVLPTIVDIVERAER